MQQQVFEVRLLVEGFLDPVEELARMMQPPRHSSASRRSSAASRAPSRRLKLHEALGVAADLRSVQRLPDRFDELLLVGDQLRTAVANGRAVSTLLARTRASSGPTGPGVDRLGDQRAGHAQVERELAHPLAGPLGAGHVEDLVDQVAVAPLIVLDAEDVARDLDQVAFQLAAVPLVEDVVQLVVGQAERRFLEHQVRFADELHVAVLDAVVDHLHVVPGAARPDPFAAGDVVVRADLGGDRLENRLDQRPGLFAAAGHHARGP
jgi:hypothetical protein